MFGVKMKTFWILSICIVVSLIVGCSRAETNSNASSPVAVSFNAGLSSNNSNAQNPVTHSSGEESWRTNRNAPPRVVLQSSSGQLIKESVERAVNQLVSSYRMSGSIEVEGIQEQPQSNSAIADLRFVNFEYPITYEGQLIKAANFRPPAKRSGGLPSPAEMFPPRRVSYSRMGKAQLAKYTDGRWVVKRVSWDFDTAVIGTAEVR
jgi:hypothetical protein